MKAKLHTNETYSTNRTLETFIWIFGLVLLFAVFSYTNASANTIEFSEESYIDDIPFDTEMIVYGLQTPEFDFEEEEYIDDIPFNTACVTANCVYKKAIQVVFEMNDEEYIDDLPFSTVKVAENYSLSQSMSVEFEMEDETYIDDIPFDTYAITHSEKTTSKQNLNALTVRNQ